MKVFNLSLLIALCFVALNADAQKRQHKNVNSSDKAVNEKFERIDANSDRVVSFKEFSKFKIAKEIRKNDTRKVSNNRKNIKEGLKRKFAALDLNNNGFIEFNEFAVRKAKSDKLANKKRRMKKVQRTRSRAY